MQRRLMVFTLLLLLGISFGPAQPAASAAPAAAMPAQQTQPEPAAVLCLPGIYTYSPGDCLPSGPSA